MSIHPPSQHVTEAAAGSTSNRTPVSTRMRAEALEAVADARELLDQGEAESAMQKLRPVFDEDRAHAQVRSYYGLTLGLARRRYQEALDLCQSAVKQEFFNPELYVNVARLNLAFGFKAESLRYLRRARMIDPGNAAINRMLDELGPRATPVLSFLPRRHLVNRWLGNARYALSQRTLRPMPDEDAPAPDQAIA
jgi:tetratricopeptide (TPR) repeat protein